MADESTLTAVRRYLKRLIQVGVPVHFGVVFGSQARQEAHDWSDVDLLVVSPRYDQPYSRQDVNLLWRVAAYTDSRIEPIPVGLHRWETDDGSTILEVARREGTRVTVQA